MTKQALSFNPNHIFVECLIVVTNNYKDYRFLQGIEVLRPAKIRKIPQ